ncbi:MAG: heme utilization cystosolic carrier protein HutX [Candidatus Accumulibacter sp.]|jgi:putative heme utilization carrier protein HutX|nr:heme utilization cystosolic carrier protein HutX [Accumulibacter sp.]
MAQTSEIEALKKHLEKNPAVMLEGIPEAGSLSMAERIECLPASLWTRIDGKHYLEVLEEIATWGKVTLIVHTLDMVLEFSGPFPPGKLGHGYYNLGGSTGLHGHLRPENCGAVYLIKRPFMGKASASVQFMNLAGETLFKVYLGRDESREIFPHQIDAFDALGRKYAPGTP